MMQMLQELGMPNECQHIMKSIFEIISLVKRQLLPKIVGTVRLPHLDTNYPPGEDLFVHRGEGAYPCPAGWCRIAMALEIPEDDMLAVLQDWHVAYHGTQA